LTRTSTYAELPATAKFIWDLLDSEGEPCL